MFNIPENPFNAFVHKELLEGTGFNEPALARIMESFIIDDKVLEPICWPSGYKPEIAPSLSEVFWRHIPRPFKIPMLEYAVKTGMQNLRVVDISDIAPSFAIAEANEEGIAARVHELIAQYIIDFAPNLQSLTLQNQFKVTPDFALTKAGRAREETHLIDDNLLRARLAALGHKNAANMAINVLRTKPFEKLVRLDLINHRVESTFGLSEAIAQAPSISLASGHALAALLKFIQPRT
jgi:hypothetical protein